MIEQMHHVKEEKARALAFSQECATLEWKRHTELHWSVWIGDTQLNFWPSVNKFRFGETRTQFGDIRDVEEFYRENS